MEFEFRYLGDGVYEAIDYHSSEKEYTTGRRDSKGRWNGLIEIECRNRDNDDDENNSIERVNMVNGKRDGVSKTTYYNRPDGNNVELHTYSMGILIDKQLKNKGIFNSAADISAFQVLKNKYPWFLLSLNVCGYDSAYIKSYMNTFETKLSAYTYDATKFDEYYGDVTDELEETPYDSIIALN
jgi:hypothetical protein